MQGQTIFVIFVVALLASVVVGDISQTTITPGLYTTFGNGLLGSNYIQITPASSQTAGIVLYSTQQTVGYGFTTEFTYTSTGCYSNGGDGFNFIVTPSTSFATLQKGGSMAVVGQTNIAVVAYDGYGGNLRICSVPSGTTLSWSNCVSATLPAIRCNGQHTFKIIYTPNSSWQLWVDNNPQSLTGPKGLTGTLSLNPNSQAYVGFAGATGDSYMNQQISSWTFTSTPTCSLNNGGCDTNAACAINNGAVTCTCNEGFTGNGYSCTAAPIAPPIDPPIYVAPPVDPPIFVVPPVDPPVFVAPPVDPPVYVVPPVDPPVFVVPPVDPPVFVAPPVVDPPVTVNPPIDVTPPVSAPIAVPPVSGPVALPPVDVPISVPVSAGPISVPIALPPVDVPISLPPISAPIALPPVIPPVPVVTPVKPPLPFEVPVGPPVDAPVTMPVIIPILECFDDLQNGSYIAYFGYNNTMGEQVVLPVGSMNTFGFPSFIGQPTTFAAGRSDFYPDAAFAYLWNGRTLIWTLTSFRLTLDTSDTSRKCPSFARFSLTFYTERQLTEEEIGTLVENLAKSLGISVDRIIVKSVKYTPVTRKRDLSVAELEMEIAAANSTQQNEPSSSQAVQTLVETSKNTTALTQVLDPTGTQNLQVLGVKSAPTGVEQSGNAVPEASKGDSPRSLLGSSGVRIAVTDLTLLLCCFVILSLLHITVR